MKAGRDITDIAFRNLGRAKGKIQKTVRGVLMRFGYSVFVFLNEFAPSPALSVRSLLLSSFPSPHVMLHTPPARTHALVIASCSRLRGGDEND